MTTPLDLTCFEQRMRDDPDVRGLLYTGSLGRGTADRFSDLDLMVWVSDDAFSSCAVKQRQLLTYIGEIQFLYGQPSDATAFVTSDWQRVDLLIQRAQDLRPQSKYATATIVKDTDGYLATLIAQSPTLQLDTHAEDVLRALSEAIDAQIYLALHNARGAVWSALGEVSYRCSELYTLLARLRGEQSFGFRYVEGLLSSAEQQLLSAAWPKEPTQTEVRRAAGKLWEWTELVRKEAEHALGSRLDLDIDKDALLAAVNRIYKRPNEVKP